MNATKNKRRKVLTVFAKSEAIGQSRHDKRVAREIADFAAHQAARKLRRDRRIARDLAAYKYDMANRPLC